MTPLRSEDWSVRPSFVPNGPTSPVTLLADDTGLTQLAGIPPVAWQTPWSEITDLELIRFAHQMALFATISGVRYCWRQRTLEDYEVVRTMVLEQGGVVSHRRRRLGVLVVVGLVLLASVAGGIAAIGSKSSSADEILKAKDANLTLKDLPSGWYKSSRSLLSEVVGPSGNTKQIVKQEDATLKEEQAKESKATVKEQNTEAKVVPTNFQNCLGVSNTKDRIFGKAAQYPDYQESSSTFATNSSSGVEVLSSVQYYPTTVMVRRDTKEMTKSNFGTCITTAYATYALEYAGLHQIEKATPSSWQPVTFAKGFVRGGDVRLKVPGIYDKLDLVDAEITHGHYEVTMLALVGSFAKTKTLLSGLVGTLLGKITNSSTTAA